MNDDQFNAIADRIQEQIFLDTKKTYGEKDLELWRNPRFNGKIDDADAHGQITGKCGDTQQCPDRELHIKEVPKMIAIEVIFLLTKKG